MTYEGEEPIEHNGKKVVAFKESGEWTIPEGVTNVDVLVVAGGGGGGNYTGGAGGMGGAGAGGLVFVPNFDISEIESPITITVGDGGTSGSGAQNTVGNNGEDSIFDSLTAKGGGGGGGVPGVDGGSAGGGSLNTAANTTQLDNGGSEIQTTQSGDSGTFGHGNDSGGGRNGGANVGRGGGGGGSGQIGATGTASGNGGDGLKEVVINSTTYNFATLFGDANTGENISDEYWYAGGGGGNGHPSSSSGFQGDAGKGGGANGILTGNGLNGVTNTGGGASSGGISSSNTGGTGGSGIVLIAYEEPLFIIKGTVTLNSTNVEGAQVRLINDTTDSYVGDTLTDVNGAYEFEVGSDTDDYQAMVEYESGGNKYHTVSYPFIKGGEDE